MDPKNNNNEPKNKNKRGMKIISKKWKDQKIDQYKRKELNCTKEYKNGAENKNKNKKK